MNNYDVAVIGGGPSGFGAAIGAANQGVSVVLIEKHAVLGGMGSAALVNIFCNAHFDGDRFIIGGVFGQVRGELIRRGKLFTPEKIIDGEPYDPKSFADLLLEKCLEQNISVLFNQVVVSISNSQDNRGVFINLNNGITIQAKTIVDATGDATIARKIGVRTTKGRASDNAVMPLTYCFITGPIDLDEAFLRTPDVKAIDMNSGKPFYFVLHQKWVTELVKEAIAAGEWEIPRDNGAIFSIPGREEFVSVNFNRVAINDPTDSRQILIAESRGKIQVDQNIQFFRKYLPGFEGAELVELGKQIGVRESYQIKGCYKLKKQDVINNMQFPDVIAQCCYGIDEHQPDSNTWSMDYFKRGQHYDIPLRSLIPEEGPPNLIVAGRAISAEREAMASFRVQPSVIAIGEAAGVTAALNAIKSVPMKDIQFSEVQARLIENEGILE